MPELVRMPEVAADTPMALLTSWSVPVAGRFSAHEALATVETAKAAVDIEAEHDGVLLATLVPEGADVEVGTPIALIGAVGEEVADIDAALVALGAGPPAPSPDLATTGPAPARIFASPLARRLARNAGLAVEQIAGTGPNARVVRKDVEAAIARNGTASGPAPATASELGDGSRPSEVPANFVDVTPTRFRRAIAARLVESKQSAPHFYLRGSARVDALMRLRSELNAGLPVKVTLNDLIVKAVAQTHLVVPEMNVIWTQDALRSFSAVDVAVAVSTDQGVLTPVLRGVDTLSVTAVTRATSELVTRARSGTLHQRDLEGGSITVTNLGMYGTEEFAAVINPPQSAILAVGAAKEEAVVVDGQLAVAPVLHVTLSVDHRPVDGVTAARWMRAFTDLLENPLRILA